MLTKINQSKMRTKKCLFFFFFTFLLLGNINLLAQCTEAKDAEMAKYMKLTKTQDAQGCSQCGMLALYFCSAKYCVTDEDKTKVGAMITAGKQNVRDMGQPYCCPDYLNKEPQWGIMAGKSANTQSTNAGENNKNPLNASPSTSDKTTATLKKTEQSLNALNSILNGLQTNPENPLQIDKAFLSDFSDLLPEGNLKNTLQSYGTNLGVDADLSYRQVYWDMSGGFKQNPSIAGNSQFANVSQGLNLMFDNYNLIANKLKNNGGKYELGSFINDPSIMNGLTSLTGSAETAQTLGASIELASIFVNAFTAGKEYKDEYKKLAALSIKNMYAEIDANLNGALIDAYVGIENDQRITPMYRYDFENGASLRVENGILKYFNAKKAIIKNLMVVDKRHDGNYYKDKDLRGYQSSTVAVSPDESVFYIFVNPKAISEVKCEDCLKKCGYSFETDNGEIIHTALGIKYGCESCPSGWPGHNIIFNKYSIPTQYGLSASLGFFHISGGGFLSEKMMMDGKGQTMFSLLDKNKKFIINGKEKKFKDNTDFSESIFRGAKSPFFYLFEKEDSYISLIWANSLNEGLLAGDGTSYSGSMVQVSKSKDFKKADYFNADAMLNELTGLAMTKTGDMYFAGKNGTIGKLVAGDYKLDDQSLAGKMRSAMNKKVFTAYDFTANKKYVANHGQINTPESRFPFYPKMKFTPDEKILVYTVTDNLYVILPDDLNNIKTYKLSCHPYDYYFTKESGDWVINLQSQDEFKFPITKKYSLAKLSTMEIKTISSVSTSTNANFSLADELKKLKDLFDSGAITQEEYDAAKKQILNK